MPGEPETLALTRKSQLQSAQSKSQTSALFKSSTPALSKSQTRRQSTAAHYPDHLRGTAQWQAMMKRFSEANKETCRSVPIDLPLTHRSLKTFPTGSNYTGTWNTLGMSGEGTYTFSHKGVVYKGGFDDGMFHGDGSLFYECGAVIKGKWNKGKLAERHLFFADGLEYVEADWAYCRPFDRRFTVEYDNGLEPADLTYKTAEQPTPLIPYGYYDVGDGLYDPKTKTVYKYDDLTAIVRSPCTREAKWIEDNCRVNPDLPKGPCPFLYEKWLTPTLERIPEPPPSLICSSTPAEEPEPDLPSAKPSRSRFSLFRSRMGLCSKSDFYDPHFLSKADIGTGSRFGMSLQHYQGRGVWDQKINESSTTNEYLRMQAKKVASVGFKFVEPKSTEIMIKAEDTGYVKSASEWALREEKQTNVGVGQYSDWNAVDESVSNRDYAATTQEFDINNQNSWDSNQQYQSTPGLINQSEYDQNIKAQDPDLISQAELQEDMERELSEHEDGNVQDKSLSDQPEFNPQDFEHSRSVIDQPEFNPQDFEQSPVLINQPDFNPQDFVQNPGLIDKPELNVQDVVQPEVDQIVDDVVEDNEQNPET